MDRNKTNKLEQQQKQRTNFKQRNKSKNVLDIQIIPGHPHGAWVECYKNTYDVDAQRGVAEQNAEMISQASEEAQQEKVERLKRFQEEVSKRVTCLQKLKRRQLQLKSLRSIDDERNVVIQRTLGLKLPYRGTIEDLQALNKVLLKSCIVPCDVNKHLFQNEAEISNQLLQNTCYEVQSQTRKAREKLLSKKIEENDNIDEVPGGCWSPQNKKNISKSSLSKRKLPKPPTERYPSKPPTFTDTWTGTDEIQSHGKGEVLECDIESHIQDMDDGTLTNENDKNHNKQPDVSLDRDYDELISVLQRNLIYDWCTQKHQETDQEKNQVQQ